MSLNGPRDASAVLEEYHKKYGREHRPCDLTPRRRLRNYAGDRGCNRPRDKKPQLPGGANVTGSRNRRPPDILEETEDDIAHDEGRRPRNPAQAPKWTCIGVVEKGGDRP